MMNVYQNYGKMNFDEKRLRMKFLIYDAHEKLLLRAIQAQMHAEQAQQM